MKVILILADGMRPDALTNEPRAQKMMQEAAYTMKMQTVMPSVTLPCHMSLFHSVDPDRHGTTTNTYTPQVRPIDGLCEMLEKRGKHSAFFYSWAELRDLTRPGAVSYLYFRKGREIGYELANDILTDAAIELLSKDEMDFTFLYLGLTDAAGHKYGWMSDEYMKAIDNSWKNIQKVVDALGDRYVIMVTADHGGHDRIHGTDLPEDMTIPFFVRGGYEAGKVLENASILDIAPTIAKLVGIDPSDEWEGKVLGE